MPEKKSNAVKLTLAAHDSSVSAVEKMKRAGEAILAETVGEDGKAVRGAKTRIAEQVAEHKGIAVQSAKNFVTACVKAFETNAETVRAASGRKPEKKTLAKKRFAVKAQAEKTIARLGESNAEKLALEILKRQGYVFAS